MVRSLTGRGTPKAFTLLIAALMALSFVPLAASPASADTPNFEIDGDQAHDSAEDWADLSPGTMPDTATKTHRELVTFVDNTTDTGADDTVFGENNKEDPPGGVQWPNWVPTDNGNATGKSDYGRIASYSYVEDDHVFLVLGFDRGSNPQGTATANYYFELNQAEPQEGNNPNPVRTIGDVRINLNDDGSNLFTTQVEVWDGDSWVDPPSAGDFVVESNDDTLSDLAPWWTGLNAVGGSITPEGFVELAVDLTSFGVVLGCPSTGFSALNGRSTTGESEKNLVDYFAARPINIPSTCADLVIHKVDQAGNPLGGATFRIAPNPLPEGIPGSDLANLVIFDDSDGNTTVEAGTNYDDPDATAGRITLAAVVPGVAYTITEIAAPALHTGDPTPKTVTPEQFGGSQVTFVNQRHGSLTIKKVLNGPVAGASTNFVVSLDCTGTQFDVASIALNAGNSFTDGPRSVPAGTQCSVRETSVPAGWTFESISPAGGNVTIGSNTAVTVTVTNKRNTGAITVTKNIVDAPRGTTGSFTFDVDCPGTEFDQSLTISVSSGSSASKSTGQIPTGLACTVTERSNPNWKQTSVVPAGGVVTVPGTVTFANAPVTEVLPERQAKPPEVLPRTGSSLQTGTLAGTAVGLVGLGLLLVAAARRRQPGENGL